MGTPSGLDVVLGYAKADLNTFTPQELKQVMSHFRYNLQPILSAACPSKKISQHVAKIRSDARLIGSACQNPLMNEYALELGWNEIDHGKPIAQNIQRHERTTKTVVFLTKKDQLALWKVVYQSTVTGPSKWVNRIESEYLIDLTEADGHPDLTAVLVYNCIQMTSGISLYSLCRDRRAQLAEIERVCVRMEQMAQACTISRSS